jgi:CubicO group peptidase (beta-lactamase class C family)
MGKEIDRARLDRARALCRQATEAAEIPGIALVVARDGEFLLNEAFGQIRPRENPQTGPLRPAGTDTVWLIASVTKPVVCAGICLLLERGLLGLDDPVSKHLPEFSAADRARMTLRHLLTHTSGLPDMLPENIELRKAHQPPSEFARRTGNVPLLFPPGSGVSYQSTGINLLGEIIERISGLSCREFLRREFFEPLGMDRCALGWRPELTGHTAAATLEGGQGPSDWDWNSDYWGAFGAPWGGMFATAPQYVRFLQMLLAGGVWQGRRIFGTATVREMTSSQTMGMPGLPDPVRRAANWGLGWRISAGRESEYLGDLTSPRAYGHGGATGTGVWNDPDTGVSFVFFSNRPGCGRFIGLLSKIVAAAVQS